MSIEILKVVILDSNTVIDFKVKHNIEPTNLDLG